MSEQPDTRASRLAKERALYRYHRAFERGDIEIIEAILQIASHDDELERMIYAMHDADRPAEQPPVFSEQYHPYNNVQPPSLANPHIQNGRTEISSREPHERPHHERKAFAGLQTLAAFLVVIALIAGSVLLFHAFHSTSTPATHTNPPPSPTKTVAATPQAHGTVIMLFTNGEIQATHGVTGQSIWSYNTGIDGLGDPNVLDYRGLVVHNGKVYVLAKNDVFALNAESGQLLWQHKLPAPLMSITPSESQILVDAGIVYVSYQSEPQSVAYALNAGNGQVLWQVASTDVDAPLLAASNGVAYVALQNSAMTQTTIEAVRGSSGAVLWSYISPGVVSFATVANQVLYVYAFPGAVPYSGTTKQDKQLLAFKTGSGDLIWSRDVNYGNYINNIMYAQGVLVINDGENLCAHSSSNGQQLWCTQGQSTDDPLYGLSGFLAGPTSFYAAYTVSNGLQIDALNYQSGHVQWTSGTLASTSSTFSLPMSPLALVQLQQNTLLVATGSSAVTALNTSNGHALWHTSSSASKLDMLQMTAIA